MNNNDRAAFDDLLLAAAKLKRIPIDSLAADLFFELVQDYPFEDVRAAFMDTLKTSDFFPQPSDITKRLAGNTEKAVTFAYENAKAMILKGGVYSSFMMKDRAAMLTVRDMGGIREFVSKVENSEKDAFFEFKRGYSRYAELAARNALPDYNHLPGEMEKMVSQNSGGGFYELVIWDTGIIERKKIGTPNAILFIESNRQARLENAPETKQIEGGGNREINPIFRDILANVRGKMDRHGAAE